MIFQIQIKKYMAETQPSSAWKSCGNNAVAKARKRRAPAEENNRCNRRPPHTGGDGYESARRFPQTDSECGTATISAPRAQLKNSADSASSKLRHRNLSAYRIGCKMGRGNYGVVYKAQHSITDTLVAIKCLKGDPDGEGVPSTTLREISLLRDLNHPNIIR